MEDITENEEPVQRLRLNSSRRYIISALEPKAAMLTTENLQTGLVFSLCFRLLMPYDLHMLKIHSQPINSQIQ